MTPLLQTLQWLPILLMYNLSPKSGLWVPVWSGPLPTPTKSSHTYTPPWPHLLLLSSHAVPAMVASLLFITTATFGALALDLLFAWNILSPGYPHAFPFTFFCFSPHVPFLEKSSLIALYKEEHPPPPLHDVTSLPCPVFPHSTYHYLTYISFSF